MISNPRFANFEPIMEYMQSVPFDVSRRALYTAAELYRDFDPSRPETFDTCHDTLIYRHYIDAGKITREVNESLARTLHDHGMMMALGEFFCTRNNLHCVGVMGGHASLRTDDMYRQITFLSKQLTENGFFMLSGGGPGAMEATHLGAWMAGCTADEVDDALRILTVAPSFHDDGWLATAFEVINKYPQTRYESLGIPTWLYGHEPSTPFATHIAKFFDNSIREDNILTLPFGGIIYTPGSAGTMQEIFQDAVQNHYLSYGLSSPMIFLGTDFWNNKVPIYPLMEKLMERGKYKNLRLTLTDDFEIIMQRLVDFRKQAQTNHGN